MQTLLATDDFKKRSHGEASYFTRPVIENVQPEIDSGRFPVKRILHDKVLVTADIYTDGIDALSAVLLYRRVGDETWRECLMHELRNDSWCGGFKVDQLVPYEYTIEAWIVAHADRRGAVRYDRILRVTVDPPAASFCAWYELFPRSTGTDPHRSATFREAELRLPGVAAMGFSVVYLPPIHPIGTSFRKGPNNSVQSGPQDPGSPWAIGSAHGGHKSVDPALGTIADFDHFVQAAHQKGLDVALDLAYQCSPDHPYIQDHPEWFRHEPDGSVKHAENPPKKYEDIVPFDFECDAWPALWKELKDVVLFWIGHGIDQFRVDNPHTKPYRFWEWLIQEIQHEHPGTLFLAEAFTRPKPMRYLAKCGFTQSYTYFTWRNTKEELTTYLMELTQPPISDYLRRNFFTNTPDILSSYLQTGGRAAHQVRLLLAATLSSAYGIYGPSFELCENRALPNSEDYQDSEKYQIRVWDWDRPGNIKEFIARVNHARRENAALQSNESLRFCSIESEHLIAYLKYTQDLSNIILTIVNLDTAHAQWSYVKLPLADLGIKEGDSYHMHDLLSDADYVWRGERNFVRLDPAISPGHLFRLSAS